MRALLARLIRAVRRPPAPPVPNVARAQWSAVKLHAIASDDPRVMTAIAHAETAAREHIRKTYGMDAIFQPTESQLEELCEVALRHLPHGLMDSPI